ncbi:hypothetical protein ABPG72_000367 [Tetrahymena utriculariae]
MSRKKIQFAFILTFVLLFVISYTSHPSSGTHPTSPDVLNYADFKEVFRDDFYQDQLNTTNWQVGDNLIRPWTNQYQLSTKDNHQVIWTAISLLVLNESMDRLKLVSNYLQLQRKTHQNQLLPDEFSRLPFSVELDIMEYSNVWTKDFRSYVFNTLIYGRRYQDNTNFTVYYRVPPLKLDFTKYHTYGMLWSENEVTMYIDGIAYFTYVGNDPSNNSDVKCPIVIPNRNFFLIFGFAVQEKFAKPEHYPKQMYVDYVRVLKPKQE